MNGKFFHLHVPASMQITWLSYMPVKDNELSQSSKAYCAMCMEDVPNEVQILHNLQKLKGKI